MRNRVIKMPELTAKVGLAKATIYRYVAQGQFPPPVRLGPKAVGWLEDEIDDWIQARPRKEVSRRTLSDPA